MSKAFVDTTVLADYLLKPSSKGKAAKAALSRFDETELPVYAIKEFKAGALHGYIWLHNAFVTEGNYKGTVQRIHGLSTSLNKNLTSTALEALTEGSVYYSSLSSKEMVEKYGEKATGDSMLHDAYRLRLKELIYRAWRKRRSVTTRVVLPIICYQEADLYDTKHGLISYKPYKCDAQPECSLASGLRANLGDLKTLESVVAAMPKSGEQTRRYHALHDITRMPRRPVTEKMCRSLGDAIFAFFAPPDSKILTTNVKDHEPLAKALNKEVERP